MIALVAALWPAAAPGAQGGPPPPIYSLSLLHLADGAYLEIPPNVTLLVDMSPATTPNLGGVFVRGKVVFSPSPSVPDVELRTQWIVVGTDSLTYPCELQMGSSATPIGSGKSARLTLINGVTPLDPATLPSPPATVLGADPLFLNPLLVDGGVVIFERGKFNAYGEPHVVTWTELAAKGKTNDQTITVKASAADLVSWAGKEIVVASTDFDQNQAEVFTIGSISGGSQAVIDFTGTATLARDHYAFSYAPSGKSGNASWTIDEKAEVGLLTRNVVISAQTWTGTAWSAGTGGHGHVILARNVGGPQPVGHFSGAQFLNLGVAGENLRYPLHFHATGDYAPPFVNPSFVKNCSFTRCFNKFVVLHETQQIDVVGNVGFDTIGNGFFLEDMETERITLQDNLGLLVKAIAPNEDPAPDREPAVFWMVSADNKVSGNRAAGSEFYGFWYSPMSNDSFTVDVNGVTSFFKDNVSHSNGHHGFYQDKYKTDPLSPRAQPWYTTQPQMQNCTAYKNRRYGVWVRSYGRVLLDGLKVADNRSGYYFASDGFQKVIPDTLSGALRSLSRITLKNSLAIGETDKNLNGNLGYVDPSHLHEWEAQRSLPQPIIHLDGDRPHDLAWAFLTGIDLYDGLVELESVRFADLHDRLNLDFPTGGGQEHRIGAAISQVAYDSQYMIDPRNRVTNIEFASVDRRVAFRYPSVLVSGANMIKNTIVLDLDGKLTNPSLGAGFLLPGNQTFLTHGVTGTSLLALDQVLHVPVANADYASLVIETPGASSSLYWTKLTHTYPTAGPAQKVREANSENKFPLAVVMNREYALDYLNSAELSLVQGSRPLVVDLNLRFAKQADDSVVIAVPWCSTVEPLVLKVNNIDMFEFTDPNGLADLRASNNLVNSYYWDPVTFTIYVKLYSALKTGSIDLISTGTEQLCHLQQQ